MSGPYGPPRGNWWPKPYRTLDGLQSTSKWFGAFMVRNPDNSVLADGTVHREANRGVQRLLEHHGQNVGRSGADGLIGRDTDAAIRRFQESKGLKVDGWAGPATHRALIAPILRKVENDRSIPDRLLCGKVWFESGFDPGAIGANGWDMGPAQINLSVHPVSVADATSHVFWVPWTSDRFMSAYNRYRTMKIGATKAWDPAILQHNWPVGADRWASTGNVPTHASMDARPEVVKSEYKTWAEFYVGQVRKAAKLFQV